jgi:hypothetical protein
MQFLKGNSTVIPDTFRKEQTEFVGILAWILLVDCQQLYHLPALRSFWFAVYTTSSERQHQDCEVTLASHCMDLRVRNVSKISFDLFTKNTIINTTLPSCHTIPEIDNAEHESDQNPAAHRPFLDRSCVAHLSLSFRPCSVYYKLWKVRQ